MAYAKSDMRVGAQHRIDGARRRLDAALATPAAQADGAAVLVEALRTNDHVTARTEVARIGKVHREVAEAWKELGEAIKFYGFALLTDIDKGADAEA